MAEEAEDTSVEEAGGGTSSGKKLGIIIAAAVVVLLCGGIGAAYFLGAFDKLKGHEGEEAPKEEHAKEEHAAAPAVLTYYQLPEFLVNLSGPTTQTSFIKIRVTLELPSEQDMQVAQQRLPKLQDTYNTYLRDLRASDLSGTAGMYRLKEELLARTNHILQPEAQANQILFTEILVQ